jgi:CubicO group peptidase (beta-lactamase class C family)
VRTFGFNRRFSNDHGTDNHDARRQAGVRCWEVLHTGTHMPLAHLLGPSPEACGVDSAKVAELFAAAERAVADGTLGACSVAVCRGGRVAAAAAFGVDPAGAVGPRSVFHVYSATKAVVAAAAWKLIDQGLLCPDKPVADIFPEFGSKGKAAVTLQQILTFTAVTNPFLIRPLRALATLHPPRPDPPICHCVAECTRPAAQGLPPPPGRDWAQPEQTLLQGAIGKLATPAGRAEHFAALELEAAPGATYEYDRDAPWVVAELIERVTVPVGETCHFC